MQEMCGNNYSKQEEDNKSSEGRDKAQITISEFLNFLKTAYQVTSYVIFYSNIYFYLIVCNIINSLH